MKRIIFFFLIFFIKHNSIEASIKKEIINNFEKVNNLSFNFKQTIDGKTEQGDCTIKYPKKIFCSYHFKNKKILVSNGKSLVIKSNRNKQYYRYNLENTPLNLILDKELLIFNIKKLEGKLINNKYYNFQLNHENNIINIFFDSKNYNLIGWQTEDIYQNLVVTFIYDIKINKKINDKIFILPKLH